jgi:hypothetical protein
MLRLPLLLYLLVLVLDMLLQLAKLMHQVRYFSNSVVMQQHSREGPPSVLILLLFHLAEALVPTYLIADQLIKQALHIGVISCVPGYVPEVVLNRVVSVGFSDQELDNFKLALLTREVE